MPEKIFAIERESLPSLAPLFAGWEETMVWSCLQGHMGWAFGDAPVAPRSAQLVVGDFSFFAGKANVCLAGHVLEGRCGEFRLLVPRDAAWAAAIEAAHGSRAVKRTRYAIRKETEIFDEAQLRGYVAALPSPYALRPVDEDLYRRALDEPWSQDLCGNFPTYAQYAAHGIGMAVLYGEELVAGASSYSFYDGGVEIEIDTKKDHRRKGLALACGAALILACRAKGLYPSWDAHDLRSVALAERLGYHLDKPYAAYELNTDRLR